MEKQFNHLSQNIYGGRNQTDLLKTKKANDFKSNAWLTFLQAKKANLKIKKGSKGVSIFKGFIDIVEKNKKGKMVSTSRPAGFARVFNLDQTEKYTK